MTRILAILGLALMLTTTYATAKTAATVNGMIITVDETNKALDILTKGKDSWDTIPAKGKKQLIQLMSPSKLVAAKAKKDLTKKEKTDALSGFWMQKEMAKVKVSDAEAKKAYDTMKAAAKKAKSKQKIPTYDNKIKNSIKMQMAQEKVVGQLMKTAKIKVK